MWYSLAGSSHPSELDPGSFYYFTIVVDGSTTPASLTSELTSAGWVPTFVHPGSVTGLVRSFAVLAKWGGAVTSLSNESYVNLWVWIPTSASDVVPREGPIPAPESIAVPTALLTFAGAFLLAWGAWTAHAPSRALHLA